MDNDTVKQAGFVNLGALKGNVGDQNYDVPRDVDLGQYRAVTIWCRRFGVNFGTAPLGAVADMDAPEPGLVQMGAFHAVAHETRGTAAIYQLADGKRVLRFTDFETSNSPDVQVYLVAADDANDNDTVKNAGFVHVAALKGNVGEQNYELPADIDLGKYRAAPSGAAASASTSAPLRWALRRRCEAPSRACSAVKEDYEKAANLYLKASKISQINSQNPDYLLNAGIYFLKTGEKEEAKIIFNRIKEDYSTSLAYREVDKYLAMIY